MRLCLMALAGALSLGFTCLWVMTFVSQDVVVTTSRWLVVRQVEQSVETALAALPESVRQRIGANERERLMMQLRPVLEGRHIKKTLWPQGKAVSSLLRAVEQKYQQTLRQLQRDLRIFCFSNSVLFLIVALAAWTSRGRFRTLLMPALLLSGSTGWLTYSYIFRQNWLHTLLFSDYFGWLYLIWVTLLFLFLCDVAFNKLRVTRTLVEALFSGASN